MNHLLKELSLPDLDMQVALCLMFALCGLVAVGLANLVIGRLFGSASQLHVKFLLTRLIRYTIVLIFALGVLVIFGVDSGLLLGAAGVISVGTGFAARGSISNMISGFVLIAERPFMVGDLIRVGDIEGEVITIDLLAIRLATLDNLMVRIPNEKISGDITTNLTHFPIRRIDVSMTLDYDQSTDELEGILNSIASNEPLILDGPPPKVLFDDLQLDGQHVTFCCWATRDTYLVARAALFRQIMAHYRSGDLVRPYQNLRLKD
jgi:small-conductance mechanosensitive channel